MTTNYSTHGFPVKVAAIGAGNRMRTYMKYAQRHPEKVTLVAVAEPDKLRRDNLANLFALPAERRYSDYKDFFSHPVDCDAVVICTPDNAHFEPTMMAIEHGLHVLLEKPIAQTLDECHQIAEAARRKGVIVCLCHVLRYYSCYAKIKQIVDSGELGEVISINHSEGVGIDRAAHSYVRGVWNHTAESNPMLLAKCCHDIDFLLWITRTPCRRISSFGSLRWFRPENAPEGSAQRCVDCHVEDRCPFSAVNLYKRRHEWIANFDVPKDKTIDDVIDEELHHGRYGRCVYHCDNDVVDHQSLMIELQDETTISLTMDIFTQDDHRTTDIKMTDGEIRCDEEHVWARQFHSGRNFTYDYSAEMHQPHHGGADLRIMEEFVDAVGGRAINLPTLIDEAIKSHIICFEAEHSRLTGQTVELGAEGKGKQ